MRLRPWVTLCVALTCTGCFAISDVDRYSFDEDPCPSAPAECTGGERYVYVQSAFDIARPQGDGVLDGFDLDGTDRAVCGRADNVSPAGASGIDNQTSGLIRSIEEFTMTSFPDGIRQAQLSGDLLSLYVLDHVDNFDDDPCIRIQFLPGRLPPGVDARAYLDADGDETIDPGVVLDFGPATSDDATACIVDGQLRVRISGTQTLLLSPDEPPSTVDRARLRCEAAADALTDCAFGGAYPVDSLTDPGLMPVLQSAADLDFDGRRCRSVSFGMRLEAVTAQLGEARF